MSKQPSIAIIGAGLAGISLAKELTGLVEISVFEKSRGAGGRMSTRRRASLQFDHGAQFFTARSSEFQEVISRAVEANQVQEWHPKILSLEVGNSPFKREWFEPHFCGTQGMNSLAKFLAKELKLHTGFQVETIDQQDTGWIVVDEAGKKEGPFDWVICSAPSPQAEALMPDQFIHKQRINDAVFSACFALMLEFNKPMKLNFDAAVVKHPILAWLAAKSETTLLVHSQNGWATENCDQELDAVEAAMCNALAELLPGLAEPVHRSLHRWRYARCEASLNTDYLLDTEHKLAAVGDWCRGNRVEDAFLSGYKLSQWFKKELATD